VAHGTLFRLLPPYLCFFFGYPLQMTLRNDCKLPEDVRHLVCGCVAEDGYRYRINRTIYNPETAEYTCYLVCRNKKSLTCAATAKAVFVDGILNFSPTHPHCHETPKYGQRVASPVKRMIEQQARMGSNPWSNTICTTEGAAWYF
jgi:hypothetical protein